MGDYRDKSGSERVDAPEKIDLTNIMLDVYHGVEAVVAVHRAYNYLRSTVLFLGEYQLSVKICGIGNSVGDICRRHGLCECTVCPADGGSVPVYSYQWCTEGCSC